MQNLSSRQESCLRRLLTELIDQRQARVLVSPYENALGFWFGGGNVARDADGVLWLSGRYRNYGDSRTGLRAGERGLECAILRSDDGGQTFEKVVTWSKADLTRDVPVLSIEGTALHPQPDGTWELFVSSEKERPYPDSLADHQKPGTGVWSIDRLVGSSPATLGLDTLEPVLENDDLPEYLHVKDPVVFQAPSGGTAMIFCSHPYSWSSSNTGLALRPLGRTGFEVQCWEMTSRGATWDVAATRVTGRLPIPQVGHFAGCSPCAVYFYDGAECLRAHQENPLAHKRPRGYSCEEIGGAFWGWDAAFPRLERLSRLAPLFVSPWGTGASRYASAWMAPQGILATWEQSQPDGSQPLVAHFLPMSRAEEILSGK